MVRRSLITGISGFVGGFLAEHLLELGEAVMGTSPDGGLLADSSEVLRDQPAPIAWDLSRCDGLGAAEETRIEEFAPEVIYHLAALSVQDDCGDEGPSERALAINVDGTRQALELAAGLSSRPRVVFVSSAHVYAPVEVANPRVAEDAPLGPSRAYGMTKLAAEEEVRRAIERSGCNALISRAFHHTGPRQVPRLMLPQWIRQVAEGGDGPIKVYTRDAWLDLCDVRDVVSAYRLLAEKGRSGEVYNVGTGVSRRSGDILEELLDVATVDRPVVELRPGFKQEPIADPTRLAECTGWKPVFSMRQTIADTLRYWRERLG